MSFEACEDCGTRMSKGYCPNCNEEVFIEEQYEELGLPVPIRIIEAAANQRENPALPWRK